MASDRQLEDALLVRGPGESQRRAFWLMCAVIGLPGVIGVVGLALTDWLQSGQCPAESLFWGGLGFSRFTLSYTWALPAFAWFGVRAWLGRKLRSGELIMGLNPLSFRRVANWGLGIAFGAAVLLSVDGAFAQFCVLGDHIVVRPSLLASPQVYPWTDVQGVVARCIGRDDRSGVEDFDYTLVMSDGRRLDFASARAPIATVVHATAEGLRNHPFSYDASRVSRQCDEPYKHLLLQRPA